MKALRFEELLLMSRPERSARRVRLHPRSTVIKGANDTGKSSLVKSLYWALGAEPKTHERWTKARVYASLRFKVDQDPFRIVRFGSRFALFDGSDELLGAYSKVTSELAPKIAELFDFRLMLRNQAGRDEQATPAFLFLPFYLDQDSGWTKKLSSFGNLGQFRNPQKDVVYFHFGIRPSAYYMAKSRKTEAENRMAPLRQEREVLQSLLERIQASLEIASFSTDLDEFKTEVESLLQRADELAKEEEKQKRKMEAAYSIASALEDQIDITRRTLAELRADQDFAASLDGDSVECPLCHAQYENGFSERFSIAVDEDRCYELLQELDEELSDAKAKYEQAATATSGAKQLAREIQRLLQTKRKKLKLADLVRSETRRETRHIVGEQIAEIDEEVGRLDAERGTAESEMKALGDKKRKDGILSDWRGYLSSIVDALDLPTLPEGFLKDPAASSKETGSDQPRAILAFFLSVVRTIQEHSTSTMCPLVIDSPNQQDQDDASYSKIRTVIRDKRPKDSQLILAVADDEGTDYGGDVIELKRKRRLLRKGDYKSVSEELTPLIELALENGAG